MIAYIEGRIAAKTENSVIVATSSGIGYEISLTAPALAAASGGSVICLFTVLIVREDEQKLFGFATIEERNAFSMLITLNRVGARTALAILSIYSPDDLHRIAADEDVAALTRVPGIGRQTAQKILIELKFKYKNIPPSLQGYQGKPDDRIFADALTGMMNLGYGGDASSQVLKELLEKEPDLDVGSLLRAALKSMAQKK